MHDSMNADANEATTPTTHVPVGGRGITSAGSGIDGGEEFTIYNILTGATGETASSSTCASPAMSVSSHNFATSSGETLTGADFDDGGGACEPVASGGGRSANDRVRDGDSNGDGDGDGDSSSSSQGGHGSVPAASDDDDDDRSQFPSVGNEKESDQHDGRHDPEGCQRTEPMVNGTAQSRHPGRDLGGEQVKTKIRPRAGTAVDCGRIDRMKLARGPVLALAASSSLALPYVLEASASISLSSLLALAVFAAGVLLTVRDFDRFFHRQLRRFLRAFVAWADGIVLDHVLRDCILTAHGCVGVAASAVGLYSLPLTTEERMEAIDVAVLQFGGEGFRGATEILAEPGGLLRLLPPEWIDRIRSTSRLSHEDQVATNASGALRAPLHGLEEDLTLQDAGWDESGDDGDVAASASSDTVESDVGSDGDEQEGSETRFFGNDLNGAFSATSDGSFSTEAHAPARLRSQRSAQRHPRERRDAPRPGRRTLTQLAIERIRRALLEASPVSFADDRTLRRIGTAASVAFLVHARSSRTARRVLSGAAHAAASLGLAGLAVGSIAALATKRVLLPRPPSPAQAPRLRRGRGGRSAPPRDGRGSGRDGEEDGGDGSDRECSYAGRRRFVLSLVDWVKSFVEGADPRIRRAQGVIVMAIMFYMARRQQRQQRNLATSRVC